MYEPRKSARVTCGGLNAGDLPVESRAQGTGTRERPLVDRANVERTSGCWRAGPTSSFDPLSKRCWLVRAATSLILRNHHAASAW